MSALVALTFVLAAAAPQVQGFGTTVVSSRPTLTIFASAAIPDVRVERSRGEVTVLLAEAEFGPAFGGATRFSWTMADGPGAIQIEKRPEGVALRMKVADDAPIDVVRQGTVVGLVFGPRGAAPLTTRAASPPPPPSPRPTPSPPVREAAAPTAAATPAATAPTPAPSPAPSPEPTPAPAVAEKPREEPAQILALRTTTVDALPALVVFVSRPLAEASVERRGSDVVISLGAEAPPGLAPPRIEPPLESIGIERRAGGVSLRVRVPPDVQFQVRRGDTLLTVVFGEQRSAAAPAPPTPSDSGQAPASDLYTRLFPGGVAPTSPEAEPLGAPETSSADRAALTFGPLSLRPSIAVSYVNGNTAILDTPQPVEDQYLEVQPSLGLEVALVNGLLKLTYDPRLRAFSTYDQVNDPSHIAGATLELPFSSRFNLGISDRFALGTLETRIVDPGGEYFFNLRRFKHNSLSGQARADLAARLSLDLGGGWNWAQFQELGGGFVGYNTYSARAGLGYELSPKLRAFLEYGYSRVPPSDERPLVESTGNSVSARFTGEMTERLSGTVSAGYLRQTSPGGGDGGQRYSGLTLSGSLRHEFRPSSYGGLTLIRTTQLSNFEQNAFYVYSGGIVDVTVPVPLEIVVRGALGYQWNTYQLDASEIGEPREDTIFGWGIGVGRPLGRRGFLRADYRRDRRRSNLPGFSITSDAVIIQLGYGLFGSSAPAAR